MLIVQPAFPAYHSSLFNRIFEEYTDTEFLEIKRNDLSAVNSTSNKFPIHEANFIDQTWMSNCTLILNLIKKHDKIIIFGNLNIWQVWVVIFIAKIYGKYLINWTQVREKLRFNLKSIIKIIVFSLCDYLYLYTDTELKRIPAFMRRKAIALNNGLNSAEISCFRRKYNKNSQTFFTIGLFTQKSRMDWLISIFEKTGYELHVIGVDECQLVSKGANIHLHGIITDEAKIAEIANSCVGFVYGGDVGLSLIHAMAYGLPPVIHDSFEEHMPEVAAFQELHDGQTFAKGDAKDFVRALQQLLGQDNTNMSKRCIDIVDNKYNIEGMFEKFKVGLSL